MTLHSRRELLKELGMGAAILSLDSNNTLPKGNPAAGPSEEQNESSEASRLMVIAAHPGDAVFTMGAPVARQIHAGGHGIFFSLTHGERGNPDVPPPQYGAIQVAATDKAAKILGAETQYLS